MSWKVTVTFASGSCSFAKYACFARYMQHTLEQYSLPTCLFLDPTQLIKIISFTSFPFSSILPPVGPPGANSRSNSKLVITFGYTPYLYSADTRGSTRSYPVATITVPTVNSSISSFCSKSIAPGHAAMQGGTALPSLIVSSVASPHLPSFSSKQFSASIV